MCLPSRYGIRMTVTKQHVDGEVVLAVSRGAFAMAVEVDTELEGVGERRHDGASPPRPISVHCRRDIYAIHYESSLCRLLPLRLLVVPPTRLNGSSGIQPIHPICIPAPLHRDWIRCERVKIYRIPIMSVRVIRPNPRRPTHPIP